MEFRDLKKQYQCMKTEINAAIEKVCRQSDFISGYEVKELETMLAKYVGVKHCITCANGTDAITLALKTWGIGAEDAVFIPDFTFFSTGECPAREGAACFFTDVEEKTYNVDPRKLEQLVIKVKKEGKYKPKVVISVDLFGQPANYDELKKICNRHKLLLLEDGAQGFGGSVKKQKACSFGDISTTSFFPTKPLGCYGDGGAVFTNNDEWASLIRSYSVHGKNVEDKYDNIRLGFNSRLDTMQAAILQVKLMAFRSYELEKVNQVALWYNRCLEKTEIKVPIVRRGYKSSWAQYTIQLPENVNRSLVQERLKEKNIPSMVYYSKPMHMQQAFAGMDCAKTECSVTERLCNNVLSLPMHPYMIEYEVEFICGKLIDIVCQ